LPNRRRQKQEKNEKKKKKKGRHVIEKVEMEKGSGENLPCQSTRVASNKDSRTFEIVTSQQGMREKSIGETIYRMPGELWGDNKKELPTMPPRPEAK